LPKSKEGGVKDGKIEEYQSGAIRSALHRPDGEARSMKNTGKKW
jgi:hypothetical protein